MFHVLLLLSSSSSSSSPLLRDPILDRIKKTEREKRNLLSDHLPPRFSLFETTFEKVELAWREKKQVETLLLLFFFLLLFFLCHDTGCETAGK